MFFAGGSKHSKPDIVQTYINAIKDSAPEIILQNCEDQVLRSQFSILIIDLCRQIKQRSFFAHFSEATLSCKLKALSFKKLIKSGAIKSSRGSSTFSNVMTHEGSLGNTPSKPNTIIHIGSLKLLCWSPKVSQTFELGLLPHKWIVSLNLPI